MISIIHDPELEYPEADEFHSPDKRFPEYQHDHVSGQPNQVYRAVRECLAQAGLDSERFGQPSWNPLGEYIPSGSRVFVLCNFVLERQPREAPENFLAKCLQGSVLRAMVDYLLLAVGPDGSVALGNAPMQHCNWDSVLRDTGADRVLEFHQSLGAPVEARDLRLFVVKRDRLGRIEMVDERPESNGVAVNLGAASLMAELDRSPNTPYRVMNYNPQRLEAFHSKDRHVYVINREILEADTIVTLPKLKTHEKTGITCALKNFVGAVGHKDSLPHYRFGSPEVGGDEFPADRTGLLRRTLGFHYMVQGTVPGSKWGNTLRVVDSLARFGLRRRAPINEGAWWGNDTAWRMVLDLARIMTYANREGELQTSPCRRHLALVDGVVGGEGEGPLFPDPVHSGLLIFSDDLVAADYACATAMGFDPQRIPKLREVSRLSSYPLMEHSLEGEQVWYNGRSSSLEEIANLAQYHYEPSIGWKGRL
jgi:uncharacterized protein (DUF362 family)